MARVNELDCDQAQKWMIGKLEGEPLMVWQEEELLAHVAACPSCRLAQKRYQRLQKGYELLNAEEPPAQFSRGWRETVRTHKRNMPRRALALAASVVLLLGVGTFAITSLDDPNRTAPVSEALAVPQARPLASPEALNGASAQDAPGAYPSAAPQSAPAVAAPEDAAMAAGIAPFAAPVSGVLPEASPLEDETAADESDTAAPSEPAIEDNIPSAPVQRRNQAAATAAPTAAPLVDAPQSEANVDAPQAEASRAAPQAEASVFGAAAPAADLPATPVAPVEDLPEAAVNDEFASAEATPAEDAGAAVPTSMISSMPAPAGTLAPAAAPGMADTPLPSATPGVSRTVSTTISLSAEDCDAVVGYLKDLASAEAPFERALRTSAGEGSASVSLNVTSGEQAAFLSYLKSNGFGGAQGEVTLKIRLTVRS